MRTSISCFCAGTKSHIHAFVLGGFFPWPVSWAFTVSPHPPFTCLLKLVNPEYTSHLSIYLQGAGHSSTCLLATSSFMSLPDWAVGCPDERISSPCSIFRVTAHPSPCPLVQRQFRDSSSKATLEMTWRWTKHEHLKYTHVLDFLVLSSIAWCKNQEWQCYWCVWLHRLWIY